jgi:hypothetical protein
MEKVFVIGIGLSDDEYESVVKAVVDKEVVIIRTQKDVIIHQKELLDLSDHFDNEKLKHEIVELKQIDLDWDILHEVKHKDDYNKQQQKLRNKYNQKRR